MLRTYRRVYVLPVSTMSSHELTPDDEHSGSGSEEGHSETENGELEKSIDLLLKDPAGKALLLRKLGLEELATQNSPALRGDTSERRNTRALANLTLSGKSIGASQGTTPFFLAPNLPTDFTASGSGFTPVLLPADMISQLFVPPTRTEARTAGTPLNIWLAS